MASLSALMTPTRARVVGLCVAYGVVSAFVLLAAMPHGQIDFGIVRLNDYGMDVPASTTDAAFIAVTLALTGPLGWLFAHWAVRPGRGGAVGAAIGLDIAAVVLGSYLIAGFVSAVDGGYYAGVVEWFEATAVFGTFGLVFLGLPMLVVVFLPALTWVALMRAISGRLRPAQDLGRGRA